MKLYDVITPEMVKPIYRGDFILSFKRRFLERRMKLRLIERLVRRIFEKNKVGFYYKIRYSDIDK